MYASDDGIYLVIYCRMKCQCNGLINMKDLCQS